jgi:hypothetical protein
MARDETLLLSAGIGVVGVVSWLALSVYPMQYGVVESGVLAGLLVLLGLFEFVLDDALGG